MSVVNAVGIVLRAFPVPRPTIAAENRCLRQQLAVLHQSVRRPRLLQRDRVFWVWLSRLWTGWRSCLVIVQSDTVLNWHRQGFQLHWGWKSRKKPGRSKIGAEIRSLIRRMSRENATWGAHRIDSELQLLGYAVAQATVATCMIRHRKPPTTHPAHGHRRSCHRLPLTLAKPLR